MAETDQQISVNMLGETHLGGGAHIVATVTDNVTNECVVEEDILQQALEEVSNVSQFDETSSPFSNGNGLSESLTGTSTGATVGESDVAYTLVDTSDNLQPNGVSNLNDEQVQNNMQSLVAVTADQLDNTPLFTASFAVEDGTEQDEAVENGLQEEMEAEIAEEGEDEEELNGDEKQTITVLNSSSPSPLGSSSNPIRIVQQGNQYTSLQQLTQEQLSQIMQVVQQQQLLKTTQQSGGSSVIFNPQTQTKIVYKVLYPSELHKSSNTSTDPSVVLSSQPKSAVTQICIPSDLVVVPPSRRPYKKRKLEDDEKPDGPDLSKEEKDERKKHRPRTRSGRVSRPPKHMVKDYKHIHPLDWDEDYDDSDGGYSDFKESSGDELDISDRRKRDTSYIPYTVIGSGKNRPWKCESCPKSYIGQGGLARHYRLNSRHGSLDRLQLTAKGDCNEEGGTNGMDMDDSNDSFANSLPSPLTAPPTTDPTATASAENTATITFTAGIPNDPNLAKTILPTRGRRGRPRGRGRGLSRGDHHHHSMKKSFFADASPMKKLARLKELLRQCDDEELMETVMPRLASGITTWEFLLMKVEKGQGSGKTPLMLVDILQEYFALHKKVKKIVNEQMKTIPESSAKADGSTEKTKSSHVKVQIVDKEMARALDIEVGTYSIQEPAKKEEVPFQYKLLTSDPMDYIYNNPNLVANRTVELVSAEEIVQHGKRGKSSHPVDIKTETGSTPVTQSLPNNVVVVSMPSPSQGGILTKLAGSDMTSLLSNNKVSLLGSNFVTSENDSQKQPQQQQVLMPSIGTGTVAMKLGSSNLNALTIKSSPSKSLPESQTEPSANGNFGLSSQSQVNTGSYVMASSQNTVVVNASSLLHQAQIPGIMPSRVVLQGQRVLLHSVNENSGVEGSNLTMSSLNSVGTVTGGDSNGEQPHTSQQQVLDTVTENDQVQVIVTDPNTGEILENGQQYIINGNLSGGEVSYITGVHEDDGSNAAINSNEIVEGNVLLEEMETDIGDGDGEVTTQVFIQDDGEMMADGENQDEILEGVQAVQTADGLVLIKNRDGTIQIHGNTDQPIPLETVQALLGAIEPHGQILHFPEQS